MGHLIAENIKYMAKAAQKACGNFCVINELCRRAGVPVYPDDDMIISKARLNASSIQRLQTCIKEKLLKMIKKTIKLEMMKDSTNHKYNNNHNKCEVNKL